jgi:hypothetical protein
MPKKKAEARTTPEPAKTEPATEAPAEPAAGASPETRAGAAEKPASPVVENLAAPETFAFEAQSISLVQGMISIAFSSARFDNADAQASMKKVVVSRLVIPPAGALNMAVRLFALLDKHGLGAAPKDPQKRQ